MLTPVKHLSEELLAAFLDGSLAPVERDRVEEHLVECPRCRMIVAIAMRREWDRNEP
jgi:anti-sigma factor RsiW